MGIIATGAKTIIDLSDGRSLSMHLGSNQPRFQMKDDRGNSPSYTPDWSTNNLVITPIIYKNNTALSLSSEGLTIQWRRRDGANPEAQLISGETVTDNILTVSSNVLASSSSGLVTYYAYVTYREGAGASVTSSADISFALVETGEGAKTCWISGEQVFKYDQQSNVVPESIELEAHIQGATMGKWQYYNDTQSQWVDYPISTDNRTNTETTLVVKPAHNIWFNGRASIKVTTSEADVYDVTSIYELTDGREGDSSPTVFLTNENVTFAANANGEIAASTETCNVVAYVGTDKVRPRIGTIRGVPLGMTIETTTDTATDEVVITMRIANDANLGGQEEQFGSLNVPILSPIETTLQLSWSKVNTGATGADAVLFSVYAPDGDTFENHTGFLTLRTQAFRGSAAIFEGAEYQWYRYESNRWSPIENAIGSTYTVSGEDVASTASFRCEMRYGGVTYADVITLKDKTDTYQAVIDSTAGNVFKNTIGSTYLTCNLWQSDRQIDTLKSTAFYSLEPVTAREGDYYYAPVAGGPSTALYRYNGSTWVNVTSDSVYGHEKTYNWYRRDSAGNPLDNGNIFATGKVIYVDGDDVDDKTTFVCEVI